MISFDEYYSKFLGIDKELLLKGKRVFISEYRDKPLNKKYFYPFIISNYYGQLVCSVSKEYYHIANKGFNGTEESINRILDELKQLDQSFRVRKMQRFSYNIDKDNSILAEHIAIPLTEESIKNIDLKGISHEDYIKRNKEALDLELEYVVTKDNKIVSRAFISDIYENGGNIVVFTKDEYRNNGYGKEVVKGCIKWCIKKDILPIYLVEDSNKPSLRIPLSLNFIKQADEFIISK